MHNTLLGPVAFPMLAALTAFAPSTLAAPESLPLDSLDLSHISQDWGHPRKSRSVDDHPLTIAGHAYPRGVGTHANSEWTINLKSAAVRFTASVGVDDEVGNRGSIIFVALVDGREIKRTPTIRGGQSAQPFDIDLTGAKELTLIVEDAGDDINYDHADWADGVITLAEGAKDKPASATPTPAPDPQIAPFNKNITSINSPRIAGGSPTKPFLFRIPASGPPPLRFAAKNLPPGLTLGDQTGVITGTMPAPGRWEVLIKVTGPELSADSTLTIVSAAGGSAVALTPPMGWNSWNVWGTAVDDAKVRAAADQIDRLGLAAHGYQFINIDDAWEGARDPQGKIQSNKKFPDMHALADYVHSKGLHLGIYSSPGPKTCAGFEASYKHEQDDAQTYAAWGIDYLKYDWCSYGELFPKPTPEELRKPYEIMRAALTNTNRDIVFSFCQYGMGEVWRWGEKTGGNLWRTTGDITDTWSSMSSIGFGQAELHSFAGPGHWNDPDMLVVGQLGWGPNIRPTHLTKNEQVTHITLWSMLAAPLLIGCDLTKMDDFTLALLTNPEVLAIDQDPRGDQAHRVRIAGRTEVWARALADGTTAVAAFNRSSRPENVTITLAELGLTSPQPIRNLWTRANLSKADVAKEFTTEVPSHGAALFRIGKAP